MITINCDTLATMSDAEFETLAFRVAYLQGMSKPQAQAPIERKTSPLGERGERETEYLQRFNVSRFRLSEQLERKFHAAGYETREDIAQTCLESGKPLAEYFTSSNVAPSPSGEDCADVETAEVDENATLESSVSLDWD